MPASQRTFNNDAIRSLRSGFPELGTVSLDGLPVNAVTAYLPIHWQDALLEAAAAALGDDGFEGL